MKLVVGLGNPGNEYKATRHNVGFICVDNYVGEKIWKEKFNALYTEVLINNEKVLFVKPQTYMNLSGISVKKFVDYFKISLEDILIIQDDLDLPLAQIKLKFNSSFGGHNGIKSINDELNSTLYARLKIGISNNIEFSTKDYVLGKFSEEEYKIVMDSILECKNIITYFLENGIDKAMNKYNRR